MLISSAPKDDIYTIELNNVEGTKGSDCFYRLNVKRIHPDFKVEARSDLINVGRNSKTEFQVIVQRTGGFTGAVAVVVDGLPKGVTMTGNTIAAESQEMIIAADRAGLFIQGLPA